MSYANLEIRQSSRFLKIEQGQPMVIRLIDADPVEAMRHSTGKIMVDCRGSELCELCQDGDEPTQRFITNVYNHTLHKPQIFEYGPMIAKKFQKIAVNLEEEGKSIMDFDLKLEAEGVGMQKKYEVTVRTSSLPVPDGVARLKIKDTDLPF